MIINNYITYTSMQSVLQDIHSMVDSIDWDQDKMLEWAVKGLRKLNIPAKYEDHVTFLEIVGHSGALPTDIKYINQMYYRINYGSLQAELIRINEGLGITPDKPFFHNMDRPFGMAQRVYETQYFRRHYRPLRRSSSTFGVSPCIQGKVPLAECQDTYTIYRKSAIQTSFKDGCIILSYKRYCKGEDGIDLVPDNEDLKDALFHFCMYRWWLSRMTYKEEGSERQMAFHLQEYKSLGRKAAANLNTPDIDTMENIKNNRDRLVPRTNFYDTGFSQLSNRENIGF